MSYKKTFEIFQDYWQCHGGWKTLLTSFYSLLSALLTAALYPLWMKENWWDMVFGILPNLLGFSLGGYAMLLAFGSEAFLKLLAQVKRDNVSAYINMSSTFVHFIVTQFSALILALLVKAAYGVPKPGFISYEINCYAMYVAWGLGFFFFIYSLFCGIAATFSIFRLTMWFDEHQQ